MSTNINENDHDSDERPLRPQPPQLARRKSSFSDTLNKFASNTFGHRRTTSSLPHSESAGNINQNSRVPTPSGISRSSSFFGGFGAFSRKAAINNENGLENEETSPPAAIKPSRKISERLASTPFFKNQLQHRNDTAAVDPPKPKERRDSGTQIKHHGLMAPIKPPLPRSSTMGSLGQGGSPLTPSFMRPTTSSAARRESVVMQQGQKSTPPPIPRAVNRLSSVSEKSAHSTSTRGRQRTSSIAEKVAKIEGTQPTLIMEEDGQTTSTPIALPVSPSPPDTANEVEDKVLAWGLKHAAPTTHEEIIPSNFHSPKASPAAMAMPEVDDWKYKPVGRRPSVRRVNSVEPVMPVDLVNDPFMGDEDRLKYEYAKQALQTDAGPSRNRNFRNLSLSISGSDQAKKDIAGFEAVAGQTNFGEASNAGETRIDQGNDSDNTIAVEDPTKISTALLESTWLGRLTSLSDRYRTEALLEASPSNSTMHPMHNDALRYRRVFAELYTLCTTLEAKVSLAAFKKTFDNRMRLDEKATVKGVVPKKYSGDVGNDSEAKEKKGVFEKLGLTGGRKKSGYQQI